MGTNLKRLLALIVLGTIIISAQHAYAADVFDTIKSSDVFIRANAFDDMIDLTPVPGKTEYYNCRFKGLDEAIAKKAAINLLRREKSFNFDEYYYAKYGVKVSGDDVYKRKREEKVMDYLYAKEGHGEYLDQLEGFIDSCEDESAISVFPGPRTFKRYPQKSAEAALLKIEKIRNSGFSEKNKNAYILRLLGETAKLYKETDPKLYGRVKAKLIELSEDACLGGDAVEAMGQTGDRDFIPVLERISKYDNTKGCPLVMDGRTKIFPISNDAKKALTELQKY